jgi:DNA-binding response OmpR family regulator
MDLSGGFAELIRQRSFRAGRGKMKPVILVVDDDSAIGELLSDVLSAHVFDVLLCQTGSDALAVAQRTDIALVLLDMILPDTNGLLVLQQLQRSRPDLPVVMLTGLGSESDVVVGLEMGADDYIAKPFNSRVVVARVKAVLGVAARWVPKAQRRGTGLLFNGWRLDTFRCELFNSQQQAVPLTQGEYSLLLALAQNARRVLNREQLLA